MHVSQIEYGLPISPHVTATFITTFAILNYWKIRMGNDKSVEQDQDEVAKLKTQLKTAFRELGQRNEQLVQKHKEVTDSINYAQRIQVAMMQPEYLVKERLEDSFIIYMPKDVVSGDFYYVGKKQKDPVVFGAIDCTGHGVPGALVPVLVFIFI